MQQSKVLYNTAFLLRPVTPVQTQEELRELFDDARKSLWPVLIRVPPKFAFTGDWGTDLQVFLRQKKWRARFVSEHTLGFEVESLCGWEGNDILHAIRKTRRVAYPGLHECSDRTEIIDIGFQTDWEGRCLRFSYNAQMRYQPFAGFGDAPKEPFKKIPKFVAAVLATKGLYCDFRVLDKEPRQEGAPSYGWKRQPTWVRDEETATRLASAILDKERPVCLVLYFGTTSKIVKEATFVAQQGSLKAHVYILDTCASVMGPIRRALDGWDLDRDVKERSCRILFPF